MSKPVPDGWQVTHLEKSIDILSGFPFKSERFTDDRSKIGLIRIRDLTKQSVETFYDDEYDEQYVIRRDDILIGMDGDFNIVKWNSQAALLNQRICKIKARKSSDIDTTFLFYLLAPELDLIHKSTGATTVKHLSVKDIRQIEKSFPPLSEQQKIAAILTSVDEAIESIQTKISKLKNLKTGLMQDLLTKGIGHTEFKASQVGRIPKDWEVKSLGDVTIESAFGPRFSSDAYDNKGNFGCIRTTDFDDAWEINYQTAPIARLEFNDFKSHILEQDDLLVTRSGTCGVVGVFEKQMMPMVAAAFLIRFRLTPNVNPRFVRFAMMSQSIQDNIQMLASGGVQKNLSGSSLKTLLLPIPSLEEQNLIVKTLESVVKTISFLESRSKKANNLKNALMQDLLTGKVRVKVDD